MLDKLKSIIKSLRVSIHKRLDRLKTSKFWQNPKFWRRFALTVLIGFLLSTGGIAFWVASLDVSKLESPLAQPTFIYDQKANKVSQLSSSKIEPVSIDKVPLQMREAIVAVEDRRFYEHQGVDVGRSCGPWPMTSNQGTSQRGEAQ